MDSTWKYSFGWWASTKKKMYILNADESEAWLSNSGEES